MLPLPYGYNAAYRQLDAYLQRLKSELPPQVRVRTVKGEKQHYLVPRKALSDGARTTIRLLQTYAINTVEQLRRVPLLLEAATDESPAQRTPPPVSTNCEALARKRGVSARTIRSHIQEGLKTGCITRKNFRGWQANLELYLAPELVWKNTPENAPEAPKKRHYAPPATPAAAKKLPPIIALERQVTEKVEIGQVEKLVPHEAPAGAGVFAGHTGPQPAPKPDPQRPATPRQASKSGQGGAAAAQLQAERLAWVTQAWHYAQRRLYPHRRFDEEEQQKGLAAMWYGVYFGFGKAATPAEWQRYHDQVLQRIDLVARYLERHPDKHLPSPYAEFVEGAGYFDAANARGFAGTLAWHERQEANNHQRNVTRALLKARQQLKAHRLGIAPKRVQALTNIQLFRYHEDRLRKLGPDALARYYAQTASPTAPAADLISFSPPPGAPRQQARR